MFFSSSLEVIDLMLPFEEIEEVWPESQEDPNEFQLSDNEEEVR